MKELLINKSFIKNCLVNNKISVLDGGARGEVFSPFDKVDRDCLKVIRFEPDPNAKMIESADQIIVPKGLWNKQSKINLNIAVSPSASSVYEYNTVLQSYIDPLKNFRKTDKTIEIECISIDEFVQNSSLASIDFIKLDIHGAEYEVLKGAKDTLKNTLGLLIESWTIPIHKNQETRGAVENRINQNGFYLFEEFAHSMWARYDKKLPKKQPVSIDSLYFKDPLLDNQIFDSAVAIKLIAISDLFGHVGYSMQLCNYFYAKNLIDKNLHQNIVSHLQKRLSVSFMNKFLSKLHDYLGKKLNQCSFS